MCFIGLQFHSNFRGKCRKGWFFFKYIPTQLPLHQHLLPCAHSSSTKAAALPQEARLVGKADAAQISSSFNLQTGCPSFLLLSLHLHECHCSQPLYMKHWYFESTKYKRQHFPSELFNPAGALTPLHLPSTLSIRPRLHAIVYCPSPEGWTLVLVS